MADGAGGEDQGPNGEKLPAGVNGTITEGSKMSSRIKPIMLWFASLLAAVVLLQILNGGSAAAEPSDAIKRLERVNAARQIAAFEKKQHTPESPATVSATVRENPPVFDGSENEGKPSQIN